MKIYRMRYHIAWKFCEASIACCGISYNGEDEKGIPKWDRIKHVNLAYEFTGNTSTKLKEWNISAA